MVDCSLTLVVPTLWFCSLKHPWRSTFYGSPFGTSPVSQDLSFTKTFLLLTSMSVRIHSLIFTNLAQCDIQQIGSRFSSVASSSHRFLNSTDFFLQILHKYSQFETISTFTLCPCLCLSHFPTLFVWVCILMCCLMNLFVLLLMHLESSFWVMEVSEHVVCPMGSISQSSSPCFGGLFGCCLV